MSLKAKLEAVIYAAEEPVTLAQLAAIFADEALQWKTEQQAARAVEDNNAEGVAAEPTELALESAPDSATPAEEPEQQATAEPSESSEQTSESAAGAAESATEEAAEPDAAAIEAEIKRAARQRDREVRAILRELLDEIVASYANDARGVEIREIAGGFRMATKPECHDAVRLFVKSLKPPLKLSMPALETLAVIAYKQPVTAPEVNEIRGVDSSGVFGSLLARKLIATAGRKQVIGRPILYKTTKEFLLRFGLKDISELPSMEEFEKMASELEELEPASETAAEPTAQHEAPELDETASEDEGEPMPEAAAQVPPAESPQRETESNPSTAADPESEPPNAESTAESIAESTAKSTAK